MDDTTLERLNDALSGRYRVERQVGEGGMAIVYLAEDLKHDRKVALKVLKPELAAVVGAERFLAEIKTTATLQHPHILPLFDSGEAGPFLFYVMPYVEGESLRERLDREKQLPVHEAMGIALGLAHALQTAHEQGIVHRDMKPGNILLSRGEPLVTDFGIALAVGAAGGSRLTETGLSVGTPFYMSPEQATGDQVVGPATDIYSLGCVLYEMLVGEPPYLGNTAQAILGKIIQGTPVSATATRKSIPPNVDATIRRALEKLPADRFTSAAEFARALEDPAFRHRTDAATASSAVGPWRRIALATSIVAALALAALVATIRGDGNDAPVLRHRIAPVATGMPRPLGTFTALAPDGSSMVYALPDGDGEGWRLWLQRRESVEPTMLPGTEFGQNLSYSPDGEWIVFAGGPELKKRPVGDGSTVVLAEGLSPGPTSMVAIAWLDDGTILYELPGNTLMRIPESGGASDTVAVFSPPEFTQLGYAGPLPGSRGALLTVCGQNCNTEPALAVIDFEADTTRVLMTGVVRGWYAPTGHLVYVRNDGAVFAAPFDLDGLELTGAGIPLFGNVAVELTSPQMVVGEDGTVLYAEGPPPTTANTAVVWVDRVGRAEPVDPELPDAFYVNVALSPDDGRMAVSMTPDPSEPPQIWVKELPAGPFTRLTTDAGFSRRPVWSLDGQSVAYVTNGDSIYEPRIVPADGSSAGAYDVLFQRDGSVFEVAFLPDGSGLVFREGNFNTGEADLRYLDVRDGSVDEALLASDFNEVAVALSPDGRWMAYTSNTSGRNEIFVRPFRSGRGRVQISTNGGTDPVWSHGGGEIFFIDGDGWMSVAAVVSDPTFAVQSRERLFDASSFYVFSEAWRRFDVDRDDERFLMVAPGNALQPDSTMVFTYVQGFFAELDALVTN